MTLRLNGSTSGYTEIDAPAVAGSNTLTLPTGNGSSGQVLSTNGSGALSWTSDVMLSAGSASAPSLYFSGDTNTGLWSPAADTLAWSTGGTERMRVTNNGQVRINRTTGINVEQFLVESDTTTTNPMTVSNTRSTVATDYSILFNRNGSIVGSIQTSLSATSYITSSDYRLKENIVDLNASIERLKQIPVHRFNFIADPDTTVDGFIAHEVQTVVPEAITGEKDAVDDNGNPIYQGIDQSKLVPLLTAALQEAIAKIESQDAAIAALETRLAALEVTP